MTVKINGGNIEGGVNLEKALARSSTDSFHLNDVTPIVEQKQVQPRLLTAMFGGTLNSEFLTTDSFEYDTLTHTAQLPEGKRYDELGARLQKDKAATKFFKVGSFGLSYNVAPKDYANRRIPNTNELMNEAYLVSQMNDKATAAWSMFDELALAQLLTADTNITRGSSAIEQYNFYTDIIGTSRPAATDMDLGNNAIDHFQAFADELDLLETDVEKTMNSMTMPVVLCGKDFFQKRLSIEKQQGFQGAQSLSRDIGGLDLASMGVPEQNFGGSSFNYQYFDSHDGLRYIRYAASIAGSKLIADSDAYLVPVGAETFMKFVYAPAQTKQYVNTQAQSAYAWSVEDDRNGVSVWMEKNVLPTLVHPQLIRRLTTGS